MLYKTAFSATDIPPLFVQLDKFEKYQIDNESFSHWKEKSRWIRFEEQAEDVLGRWSKPHVATIPQTALDELKLLIKDGKTMIDIMLADTKEIADAMANELLDYFTDLDQARLFAELFCMPHQHHHEKRLRKSVSGANMMRMAASSSNFQDYQRNIDSPTNDKPEALRSNMSSKNLLKYQYSFTDAIALEEVNSTADFKENTKFKKKVHRKAEGASILVMPVDFVKSTKLVFLRFEAAMEIPSFLEVKVRSRFIVLIIGPSDKHLKLYEIGRAMSTVMADDVCREQFYSAQTKEELEAIIDQFNKSTMVIPPGEWNPQIRIEPPEKFLSKEERKKAVEIHDLIHKDEHASGEHDHVDPTLKGSRKPFNGILSDIKRKMPFYVSDFTDCLNLQCLATTLYMYLVCLCSLVAFGGMLGKKTENLMGTIECILAGSVCGVLFSLFSGQPLNIISATGPMLILEGLIKNICDQYKIDYMEFRLWIGVWCAVFILALVAFNLSFLVKYITRFTEDCFATLVAIIFIIDAIKSTLHLRDLDEADLVVKASSLTGDSYSNVTDEMETISNVTISPVEYINKNSPDYALIKMTREADFFFSVILFLMTFVICMGLKEFRNKPFLPTKIRVIFSDFAVMIAIILASVLDYSIGLTTQKLTIPSKFQPTKSDERGWLIPFFGKNNFVTILIAIVPAIIATILIFMDQQITAVIINRKEFKLKKSSGYHLDLFIVGTSLLVCSMLGLPWFVAATVLALTHVNSLKEMSENTAPGERPKFMGVCEQRVTTLIMSILIGLSVFLTSILSFIPMAVLYGVFMFMGVSALGGMQFFQRILILFMPAKYQPDLPYLRHVSTKRVHLFTIIQIISTSGLYAIKYIESVAITFPILVLATCGVRKLLDNVFEQRELFWLDDILPGAKSSKDKKQILKEEQELLTKEKRQSEDSLQHKPEIRIQSSKSFDDVINDTSSHDDENEDHSGKKAKNTHHVTYADIDENNNENDGTRRKSSNLLQPPVKFVTSFQN